MRNWSGTVEYGAAAYAEPATIEELCAIVAREPKVRAIGTRHSFTDIPDTDGVLVTATGIPPAYTIDEAAHTVTVGAGTRYAALAAFLTEAGWALHNMGSLPHISVAGAVATGTHGSGSRNGSLATAVRGLEVVGPDGGIRWMRRGDADFPGSVVALGLTGVTTRLEIAIEPSYLVRQDVYRDLDWAVLLDDPGSVLDAAYSVSVFTDWVSPTVEQVWVKRRVASADEAVPDDLLGAARDASGTTKIIETAEDNQTRQGVAGPWSAHLPHFRIDSTPSRGDEIQTEYFVDRADGADALRAVRALAAEIRPLLLVTELRTVAADDLWMSGASGRETLAIHFTFANDPAGVAALTPAIEAALDPFAPRPHWGKAHTVPLETVGARYPRLGDFRDLVARVDPDGTFAAPALAGLIGPAR